MSNIVRRITVSLPPELSAFVTEDARKQGHRIHSRVVQEALELLKSRRARQEKYQRNAA